MEGAVFKSCSGSLRSKVKVTSIFATKACRIQNLAMKWPTTLRFGREVVLEL
jgi:hypothetical protein